MRAVIFDGELRVAELERPTPAANEVLIRPRLMGICNTDLELMQGYKGFRGTLGHEFVGDVETGPREWVGRRVVGSINITCGACDMCVRGLRSHCRNRRTLGIMNYDGVFADAFRLPVRNLYAVPDAIPDEVAVFTEPLAAACQILEVMHINPSDRVVLIGAGKLGLLAAQVINRTGVELTVIVRRERQARLLSELGIRSAERHEVPDNMADVVVDCTGNAAGFAAALDLVRPRGTIVLKSTYRGLPETDLTRIAVDEIRVVGSRCGPFDAALRLMLQSTIEVNTLIEKQFPLTQAVAAFSYAAQPGVLKVLLTP
ncbi:MAG: alcohol dehydrogenase catalytic domain-containing protein [Chloroflexi bacterium]|nr:alcohol dehydrogenase catalytic domain-containing protein [Chloroflexota bacterium]